MSDLLEKQDKLFATLTSSALGKDVVVRNFVAKERMSSLFEYQISFWSPISDIKGDKALNSEATVTLKSSTGERHFHGIITEFSQGLTQQKSKEYLTEYSIIMRPSLFLLTLDKNNLMFQNKTTLDIVKQILKDGKIKDISDKTKSAGKGKREYCVQYAESSFNFISRLMEDEGISYFFSYTDKAHTLVLADSANAYSTIAQKIFFSQATHNEASNGQIFFTRLNNAITSGGTIVADYDYTKSTTSLLSKLNAQNKGPIVYEFFAGVKTTSDADKKTKRIIEEFEFSNNSLYCESTVQEMCPGYSFNLKDHPISTFNDSYVVYSVEHVLMFDENAGYKYTNKIYAFKKDKEFRPPRITPKPNCSLQTAVVVCPKNEEIYRDKYGCVKVHFHWDQIGKKKDTDDSSCWIRVAQSIAGSGWGAIFIPRVGQEVIVDFENNDPDRPIIIGCVYNDKFLPPYLDKDAMKSAFKTVSYKNAKGFNEFRINDEKDKEEIYWHAQKDVKVEIENSRSVLIKEADDSLKLQKGNRSIELSSEGDKPVKYSLLIKKGDQVSEITEGNGKFTFKKGDVETILDEGNCTTTLKKGDMKITLSKGNLIIDVTGDITIKSSGNVNINAQKNITIDAKQGITIKSGQATKIDAGTTYQASAKTSFTAKSGTDMKINAGTNCAIEAKVNMDLKANMNITAKANMNFSAQANMQMSLKSSLAWEAQGLQAKITGTAMVQITAAIAQIGSMVKLG